MGKGGGGYFGGRQRRKRNWTCFPHKSEYRQTKNMLQKAIIVSSGNHISSVCLTLKAHKDLFLSACAKSAEKPQKDCKHRLLWYTENKRKR